MVEQDLSGEQETEKSLYSRSCSAHMLCCCPGVLYIVICIRSWTATHCRSLCTHNPVLNEHKHNNFQ